MDEGNALKTISNKNRIRRDNRLHVDRSYFSAYPMKGAASEYFPVPSSCFGF